MSVYVENGYSENYVEGDVAPSENVNCDLTSVLNELSLIKVQNEELRTQNNMLLNSHTALNDRLDLILDSVRANNTLNLSINEKLVILSSSVSNDSLKNDINDLAYTLGLVSNRQSEFLSNTVSELVSKEYIDTKIPFVDDKSLVIYPNGSVVITTIAGGAFIVESSKFLPISEHDFTVVYTLSKEIDGVKKFSDFNAKYVLLFDHELYMRISDCPSSGE